jgi:hypothetical protein
MCWKEKIQWQSATNGLRKENVLRCPFLFLDKVLHFFFLWLSVIFSNICHVTTRKLRLPQCIMGDDLHINKQTNICIANHRRLLRQNTTKRGNVLTQSWRSKSAVFRIYCALTFDGSSNNI